MDDAAHRFEADGTTMRRRISGCWFRFRGIEALGLVLNPFERTLRPMRMMLAAAG